MNKPMLTSDQLVQHMKDKGIQFNIISEDDAKRHLREHNNYFKLTSYRKNYTKYSAGPNAGKYENLEFAYLRELARIDTAVRDLLLEMALDIEHFLKVILLQEVEDNIPNGEDGYAIVADYLFDDGNTSTKGRAENVAKRSRSFSQIVSQNKNNPYCRGLTQKYANEMPIWAFVELISFGDLKDLLEFYVNKTGWVPPIDIHSLDRVRQIRNACAHGNAIINDLKPESGTSNVSVAPSFITAFVKNAGVSKTTRAKKLSNPRINQIVHLLYIYDQVVTSKNTRAMRIREMDNLLNVRMLANRDFFKTNPLLKSSHSFFQRLISTIK